MSEQVKKAEKAWHLKASDGVEITLLPIFVVRDEIQDQEVRVATNKEIECTMFHVTMKNHNTGQEMIMDIPFQEVFMLVYFCANEEIRLALQMRQEKKISYIPYEVTFKLTESELKDKMAKRLIRLPIDELSMAIARADAQLLAGKANLENINTWFAKRQAKRSKLQT